MPGQTAIRQGSAIASRMVNQRPPRATPPVSMYRVLFVCSGNICRSPTAEGVFRSYVEKAGLGHAIGADSVGLHGFHAGEPPDPRAIAAARRRGFDISALRARRVRAADLAGADLILAMDRGHYRQLEARCGEELRKRLSLFLEPVPELGTSEVPDPYYGGPEDFEYALDLIERGARAWLERIRPLVR